METSYLKFWGKAGGVVGAEPAWHPVAYHCLDVAAVADALLVAHPRRLETLARLLQTDLYNARRFAVCLFALHDIGKFSKHFQAKSPEAWAESAEEVFGPWTKPPASRHDADGYDLRDALSLKTVLRPATADWSNGEFNVLWAAITGHHGQPRNDDSRLFAANTGLAHKNCQEAAAAFTRDVRALFDPLLPLPEPAKASLEILSWLVCGLTVVSDWIGSNRDWFPYRPPEQTLAEYWDYAQGKARDAIQKAGVVPSALSPDMTPQWLYPDFAASLSPLQQHVRDMALV
ncbi:MAG: CRISPR-associated endonuclease Cas3'', partial [Hyphomicrobium sp.]